MEEKISAPSESASAGKNKSFRKRLVSMLRRHELHYFVLFIFLLILSWPFLAYLDNRSISFSFVYYFAAWILLVVFLFAANVIGNGGDNDNDD